MGYPIVSTTLRLIKRPSKAAPAISVVSSTLILRSGAMDVDAKVCVVIILELSCENRAFNETAGRHYTDLRLCGMPKKVLQAVGTGKYVIVHTPYPVCPHGVCAFHSRLESSGATYILLVYHGEILLIVKPCDSTVGGIIVDDHNGVELRCRAQAGNGLFKQFETVEGNNDCNDFHLEGMVEVMGRF